MTKSYHINELAISLVLLATKSLNCYVLILATVKTLNCCYNFWCVSGSLYSSIKHHKLKRRVELKERKILEIIKNHFGQFHKLNNDNRQLHTTSCDLSNLYNFISITTFLNTTFLCCKYAILNLSNSFILRQF